MILCINEPKLIHTLNSWFPNLFPMYCLVKKSLGVCLKFYMYQNLNIFLSSSPTPRKL